MPSIFQKTSRDRRYKKTSNMTETNRIEFKRELTDDLDIEKEVIV